MPRQAFGLILVAHVDRGTHLARDRFGHFLTAQVVLVEDFADVIGAGCGRSRSPRREGGRGCIDGGIGVRFASERDDSGDFFGRRVDDVAVTCHGRSDPFAVDVKFALFEHDWLLKFDQKSACHCCDKITSGGSGNTSAILYRGKNISLRRILWLCELTTRSRT